MYRKPIALGIVLLFIVSSLIPMVSSDTSNSKVIIYVDDDNTDGPWFGTRSHPYRYIQDGINDSSDGDTVFVYNGTYYEHLIVDTSLNLIGEDMNTTIIDGYQRGTVIYLYADWTTIIGFTIYNSSDPFRYHCLGISIHSNNCTIVGNKILQHNYGIYLYSSCNNIIKDNNILYNTIGLGIEKSSSNNITNNNFLNNGYAGIDMYKSNYNNYITNNNFYSNEESGVRFGPSIKTILKNNSFFNDGLFISSNTYQNIVENNSVNGKSLIYYENKSNLIINEEEIGQIILVNCENITIQNQELSNVFCGIQFRKTHNCSISNNTIFNNHYGIKLDYSNNNVITGNNTIDDNSRGVGLSSSSNTIINGNNFEDNHMGVQLINSNHNNITNNNFLDNRYGICLYESHNNTIDSNIINFQDNSGITVQDSNNNVISYNNISNNGNWGIEFDLSSNNNKISCNTISNNNNEGIEFDGGCCNNNISGNNISENHRGIILEGRCNNNVIFDNNISNNSLGVELDWDSDNNVITRNIISNNKNGIEIISNSNDNTISDNYISNKCSGIILYWWSNNNIIKCNTISNNENGIRLSSSCNDNLIYYNNFISNTNNTNDKGNNTWDNGMKGNYFYDYIEKNPDANKSWLKGIWDTSYEIIGGNNSDRYPLIRPYKYLEMVFDGFPLIKRFLQLFSWMYPYWYPLQELNDITIPEVL